MMAKHGYNFVLDMMMLWPLVLILRQQGGVTPILQGIVTPIRPVEPSTTGIKMKSKDQGANLC